MPIRPETDEMIEFLNQLLTFDRHAIGELLVARVVRPRDVHERLESLLGIRDVHAGLPQIVQAALRPLRRVGVEHSTILVGRRLGKLAGRLLRLGGRLRHRGGCACTP